MLVVAYHAKKADAKKAGAIWKRQGFEVTVIPGDKSLGKKMSFFVVIEKKSEPAKEFKKDKPKESMDEKIARLNKEFFGK